MPDLLCRRAGEVRVPVTEAMCLGSVCPLYCMDVDIDRFGNMTSFQAFCLGNSNDPVFLCSAEVKNGGNLSVDADVPCAYPPLWVRPG